MSLEGKVALESLSQQMDSLRFSLAEMLQKAESVEPDKRAKFQDRIRRLNREVEVTAEELGISKEVTVRVKGFSGEDEQYEVTFPIYGCDGNSYWKIEDAQGGMIRTTVKVELDLDPCSGFVRLDYAMQRGHVDFLDGAGADYWLGRGEHTMDGDQFECLLGMAFRRFDGIRVDVGAIDE